MQWHNYRARKEAVAPPAPEPGAPSPEALEVRMNGRAAGAFEDAVREYFLAEKGEWPAVIDDEECGTATVPATALGLIALVARWDSLLTDEEYRELHAVVDQMVPMGLNGQEAMKADEEQNEADMEHIREHHPEMLAERRVH